MGTTVNTVKNGSTVPLKFEVFAGNTELTDPSIISSFQLANASCATGATTDEIELTSTPEGAGRLLQGHDYDRRRLIDQRQVQVQVERHRSSAPGVNERRPARWRGRDILISGVAGRVHT
jgi:hypothetical protein